MRCPKCSSFNLLVEPVYNDAGRTAYIEGYLYSCKDCGLEFEVRE